MPMSGDVPQHVALPHPALTYRAPLRLGAAHTDSVVFVRLRAGAWQLAMHIVCALLLVPLAVVYCDGVRQMKEG